MTDREWEASRCVECYGTDRDADLYTACGCQTRPPEHREEDTGGTSLDQARHLDA